MANSHTNIAAAPAADADGYKTSVDMANGAYALDALVPTFGARHVTMTRTVVNAADTPGTITIVGKDLSGQTITEVLIPGAHTVLVTGAKFFASVASATQAGWVLGAAAADTIVIGWDAQNAVATGSGTFHGIVVNTTAAGAIVIADSGGTIATLKASIAEGFYGPFDVAFSGYLRVEPAAASDITVIHSGSMPASYAMA
jgi:hypothetical protein